MKKKETNKLGKKIIPKYLKDVSSFNLQYLLIGLPRHLNSALQAAYSRYALACGPSPGRKVRRVGYQSVQGSAETQKETDQGRRGI
jgi:hypothetical protein